MGYKPRNNLMKDENSDLRSASHNILSRWKNYFLSYWISIMSLMLGRQKYI
jgi:hypothetical protein